MLITGTFKDIDDNTISVMIYNNNITGVNNIVIGNTDLDDVYFSSDPVNISTQCDDTFTHVIKRSCTISLITKIYLGQYLYANNIRSIMVNVFRNGNIIFAGYVTPNTYNQGYANVYEELNIECVDALSVMQNEYMCNETEYSAFKQSSGFVPFIRIMENNLKYNTVPIISNIPITEYGTYIWVETGFVKENTHYYAIETKVLRLDNDTAITSNVTRRGRQLTPQFRMGTKDDPAIRNGKKYYKNYIWVTINGTDEINTGDYILGPEIEVTVVSVTWAETGVTRVAYHEYYVVETATATCDDGSIIPNYDTRNGRQLSYSVVHDLVSNTMYEGKLEYYRNVPRVSLNTKNYYFYEDVEKSMRVGTYDIEGIMHGNGTTTIDSSRGTITMLGPAVNGFMFGVTLIDDESDLSGLFEEQDIYMISHVPVGYIDIGNMCKNCTELEYVRMDTYGFADIEDVFYGCDQLGTIVFNIVDVYGVGEANDFHGVPSWATIYVQDDKVDDFAELLPFANYTVTTLSSLGILPIKRGILPSDYVQLDWLTNTTTAIIDTGIQRTGSGETVDLISIETDVIWNGFNNTSGSVQVSNTIMGLTLNYWGVSADGHWVNANITSPIQATIGKQYHVMMEREAYNNQTLTITDVDTGEIISIAPSTRTLSGSPKCYLYNIGTNTRYACRCSLGRTKIYKNGTLVRDFIPCVDIDDNFGMYDVVGNHFYTSSNSEQFTGE